MNTQQHFKAKTIVVLCGGKSSEAEVSLVSGRAVATALAALGYRVERIELTEDRLPENLTPQTTVVFPALHGGYGEGGDLQAELEAAGIAYAGSDKIASKLCMDKVATKNRIATSSGFHVAKSVAFTTEKVRPAAILWAALDPAEPAQAETTGAAEAVAPSRQAKRAKAAAGIDAEAESLRSKAQPRAAVLKPRSGGSSVGLFLPCCVEELEQVLDTLPAGEWLLERRIAGREMTIGVLGGKAQAIVEIVPEGGVYDFTRKYCSGATNYLFPAPLAEGLATEIKAMAERVFALCGCRDFARIDFILDAQDRPHFLEINTLPGLTPTSLLPKSASVGGFDFNALIEQMILPALARAGWQRAEVLR